MARSVERRVSSRKLASNIEPPSGWKKWWPTWIGFGFRVDP